MLPNAKNSKLIMLILCSMVVAGGCAKPLGPPYFKDIYDATRKQTNSEPEPLGQSPVAGQPGTETTADKAIVPAAAPKALVKIIAIPNPLKKETVKTRAEANAVQPPSLANAGQPSAEEQQKPLELAVQAAAGDVQIIVENMPVYDFVNLVFGEILKLNYTVSQDVQAAGEKITLNMNRKMDGKDFFPVAVNLMRRNNLEIRNENGILNVRRKNQDAQQTSNLPAAEIYIGNTLPPLSAQKRITLIYTTSYVPVSQIIQIVQQLQMLGGDVKTDTLPTNKSIALTGTITSLERIVALFNQLDRVTFAQHDFNLIYLDYINVMDFDKKLKEVLPALGIPIARSAAELGILTIPFEKINALLVISMKKEWLDMLLSWKDKLDAVESMGDEMQLFVYQPKNRPAEELVDVLKAVSSGGNIPSSVATPTGQQRQTARPETTPSVGMSATSLPGKGFAAILDKGRNAVVVSASPANFKLIRNILTQLDTPPRQVLIEATIMEVTLTDNLQYGVEWFIRNNIHGGSNGDFNATVSTLGGLALGSSGLNYAISNLPGDFQAKLNMFANKNQINIISTPHVAMLDGKEATINVGTEVPIVTSEASAADINSSSRTTSPSILRSVQYRNTGTILRVRPVINSEGALTIEISQELSEAQTNSVSNIDSPLILNRSIHTTLAVKSGETVLLGGLISTNKSSGESKVPFFGDLPLIGHLFKTSSTGNTKTELIVQITPYILNDLDQLDLITKKFKDSYPMSR